LSLHSIHYPGNLLLDIFSATQLIENNSYCVENLKYFCCLLKHLTYTKSVVKMPYGIIFNIFVPSSLI